jgi:hypothetical protein
MDSEHRIAHSPQEDLCAAEHCSCTGQRASTLLADEAEVLDGAGTGGAEPVRVSNSAASP